MEASASHNNGKYQLNSMADLLPELTSLLSEDCLISTAKKKKKTFNRSTMAVPITSEKFKPLTIAELRAEMEAVKGSSVRKARSTMNSTAKKKWNTSSKVDKKVTSHTNDGQMKHNAVRKVLCFQSKPQTSSLRPTINTRTPTFTKPDCRPKKSIYHQARDNVRISGVFNISETPIEVKKPNRNRLTIANKENILQTKILPKLPLVPNVKRKIMESPKPIKIKPMAPPPIPDTPLSNDSWKSSCDASFLEKEKESNVIVERVQTKTKKHVLENISEVSPPLSTPFKDYRNVQEYFNNTSDIDNSVNDNTIMCFDKQSSCKESNNNREESVIVSLCDLFNKATVTNKVQTKTELDILIEIKDETEKNIESQKKLLQYVNKLIERKLNGSTSPTCFNDKTLLSENEIPKIVINDKCSQQKSPILGQQCSVIKTPSKSPSYIIPKKNSCLRRKLIQRSMPNLSNNITPKKSENSSQGVALYMKMRQQNLAFLNTPQVKKGQSEVLATPVITSMTLQSQLDKLFNDS